MRRRSGGRLRAAQIEIVDEIENIGGIDDTVAIRVARHHAGRSAWRGTATEQIIDQIEDVGRVDDKVAVCVELLRRINEAGIQRPRARVEIRHGDVHSAGRVRRRFRGDLYGAVHYDVRRCSTADRDNRAALEAASCNGDCRAATERTDGWTDGGDCDGG